MPVSHRGILWTSSDERIKWGQNSNPPSHPPNIFFSHREPLHCFDIRKTPYFNQATQKNSFIDYRHPLKLLLLGPVTCWAKFRLC